LTFYVIVNQDKEGGHRTNKLLVTRLLKTVGQDIRQQRQELTADTNHSNREGQSGKQVHHNSREIAP